MEQLAQDAPIQDGQHRLEIALESAEIGVWEWRLNEDRVVWSSTVERIHGSPRGTFDGTRDMQQRDVHPEDREMVTAQIQRTLSFRRPQRMTYRIIRPHGRGRARAGVPDDPLTPRNAMVVCRLSGS